MLTVLAVCADGSQEDTWEDVTGELLLQDFAAECDLHILFPIRFSRLSFLYILNVMMFPECKRCIYPSTPN